MRRALLLLISILVLSSAAIAYHTGVAHDGYTGCPKHIPGCPGYAAKYEAQISTTGPVVISGNPKADRGRWAARREYADSCYWAVGKGLTCMEAGSIPKFQPKRFRREEMIAMQSDTIERQTDPRQPVRITDGVVGMSGRLGGRFAWRGHSPRLRDVYRQFDAT